MEDFASPTVLGHQQSRKGYLAYFSVDVGGRLPGRSAACAAGFLEARLLVIGQLVAVIVHGVVVCGVCCQQEPLEGS